MDTVFRVIYTDGTVRELTVPQSDVDATDFELEGDTSIKGWTIDYGHIVVVVRPLR